MLSYNSSEYNFLGKKQETRFTSPEVIDNWIVTSDSDHNEGHSKCTFKTSAAGYGLWSGVVTSLLPQDGRIKKSRILQYKKPKTY
ncbi:hypothetical protein PVAND_004023 [Polypedilum vanderplanki]|uniref:Uncharacterized protein n=1 Tax=Polypedilum vanderplanki TaxID=319348 RepID=A0A9J6BWG4_POLVA|nr:hypothetical protein PVAND_004023 [Polypedilum vanderplanki]